MLDRANEIAEIPFVRVSPANTMQNLIGIEPSGTSFYMDPYPSNMASSSTRLQRVSFFPSNAFVSQMLLGHAAASNMIVQGMRG